MEHGYLARESERVNKATKSSFLKAIIVLIAALAVIYFLGKDSLNLNDFSYGTPAFYLAVLMGILLVCSVIKLTATSKVAKNGSNLYLPYKDNTPEAAAAIIDREAQEGNILVEEYIDGFTEKTKESGEKIVLTPSYLLICGTKGGPKGTSKVTAIPRDKICWTCAQVGRKGGPFVVRLLVFTADKLYSLTGVDIDHAERIADKLYQYIPNIFSGYDPFTLSYELEELLAKNPAEFLNLCERQRNQMN